MSVTVMLGLGLAAGFVALALVLHRLSNAASKRMRCVDDGSTVAVIAGVDGGGGAAGCDGGGAACN
ncbi:hypothetical protein [Piscinibacter terrae]|uniref:Uncharacterized protein n=1 Tax=Piscinibacter terrae TaxID=2496871 RepID=A0A3N7HPE4_9BURK|nr:hypothetical protein [Albitalea terrae]RQP24078.1 hypothetical protein DZC73_12140 [Albitalea terrae]